VFVSEFGNARGDGMAQLPGRNTACFPFRYQIVINARKGESCAFEVEKILLHLGQVAEVIFVDQAHKTESNEKNLNIYMCVGFNAMGGKTPVKCTSGARRFVSGFDIEEGTDHFVTGADDVDIGFEGGF